MPNKDHHQALALLERAKTITTAATDAGREFTPDERATVKTLLAEAKALKAIGDTADGNDSLRHQVEALGRRGEYGSHTSSGRHSIPGPGPWGKAWADRSAQTGYKDALTPSGTITVPSLSEGIAELEDRPASFLQAISFLGLDTFGFQFTRQTEQELNAATVRPGHRKPVSDFDLVPIQDRARVVAHLTEGIDRTTLNDSADVMLFLDDVLNLGVVRALEQVVLHGDSTNALVDDFDGIFKTSGVRSQDFAVDPLTSIRKGLTQLQHARLLGPFLVLMNAAGWEGLELTKSTEHYVMGDAAGVGQRQLPVDTARQGVWGQRVALTEALADGEVVIGDFGATSIRVRERQACTITWSEATQLLIEDGGSGGATATGFELNKLQFRAEGRYGLELRRPWAFCIVDVTP